MKHLKLFLLSATLFCSLAIFPGCEEQNYVTDQFGQKYVKIDDEASDLNIVTIKSALGYGIPVLLVIILVAGSVYTVPGKTAKILETFGDPHQEASLSGLHIKWPWPITQIVGTVNLKQQELEDDVEIKTKDNAYVKLPVKFQYKAENSKTGAVKAHYELEEPGKQMMGYILNTVKNASSGLTLAELYEKKDDIENQVKKDLKVQFQGFAYEIVNVLVDQPQPSKEVMDAFNDVIASQREKEAAVNRADANYTLRVKDAQGEAESKKWQGQGISDMRAAIAKGAKEASDTLKIAMPTLSDAAIAEFLLGITRLDAMVSVGDKGNLILMDLNDKGGAGHTFAETLAAITKVNGNAHHEKKPVEEKQETESKNEPSPKTIEEAKKA